MTKSFIHPELEIPEYGTEEYRKWWESQYEPAESHNVNKNNLAQMEWADGFVGK